MIRLGPNTRSRILAISVFALVASLQSAATVATPPPDAVAEGFGAASIAGQEGQDPSAAEEKKPKAKKTDAQILDELLAESPDDQNYESGESCISRHQVRRIEIISSSVLLIHGSKGRRWVNQFHHRCHGLRKNQALVIEARGSRYCALDTIYGRDRAFGGPGFGSARCHFADFQPVSEEQAQIIKLAAKNGAFKRR